MKRKVTVALSFVLIVMLCNLLFVVQEQEK